MWSVGDPFASNSTLMTPNNFLCLFSWPWQQDDGYNFLCSCRMWYASIISTSHFIALLINRYSDRLLSLPREFLHIPNKVNNFFISEWIALSSVLISCAGIDQYHVMWLCLFSFSIAISNTKALGSGTSGSSVCISVCLKSLNLCTFHRWERCFFHQAKILWESVTNSLFSSFTVVVLGC